MSEIKFYRVRDPYGVFSNFSPHAILVDGKWWRTSEHYYQAHKFPDEALQEQARHLTSPREVADFGRRKDLPLRPDWDEVKDEVMMTALRAKFTQHADLKAVLLATAGQMLVEHTTNDSYWGDGGDGSGKNMLGQLLVKLREELRSEIETHYYD